MSAAPYDPFAGGGVPVGVRTVSADDEARARRFPCETWYPARQEGRDGPAPLVVYSHHSGGHRRAASYLCTHLASHGYVVAALDHSEVVAPELALDPALASEERIARAGQTWVPARVPDIRFLIDHTLATTTAAGDRVGIVGHSFGGWTALAAPDDEPRIRSVVALAPAGSEPPPPGIIPATLRFRWRSDVPTLYLVAADDSSLPLDGMYQLYERTPATKRMLILHRADHLHFVDDVEQVHEEFRTMSLTGPAAQIQQRMRPIDELCSGEQAHLFVRGLTLAHLDATLRGHEDARRFLDGDLISELASRGVEATTVE
jgi:predicted dienelactone hydrolase